MGDFSGASGVMVDWDEEREKVLARGARWVSLSSIYRQSSLLDMYIVHIPILAISKTYSSLVSTTW